VAVKVFGDKTELVVDRAAEAAAVVALGDAGFGPQVMATFSNGRAERFLHCHTLRPEQMTGPPYRERVAAALARFHAVRPGPPHDPRAPALWPSIERWLAEARGLDWSAEAVPCAAKRAAAARIDYDALARDVARVRAACERAASPVVFAHNDLLSGNILVLQRCGEGEGDRGERDAEEDPSGPLTFIDFEYGAYNPRGFDLANHFNEYAGFECDYSRYPHGDAAKADFLRAYLEAAAEAGLDEGGGGSGRGRGGAPPEEQEARLARLCAEVDAYSLASHAYWGAWSIIQARYSPIDFDYMAYHGLRWAELRKRLGAFCARADEVFGPAAAAAAAAGKGGAAGARGRAATPQQGGRAKRKLPSFLACFSAE
jgi:ethanolamine kinase